MFQIFVLLENSDQFSDCTNRKGDAKARLSLAERWRIYGVEDWLKTGPFWSSPELKGYVDSSEERTLQIHLTEKNTTGTL